jgi:Protein of unknown function (DUF2752)
MDSIGSRGGGSRAGWPARVGVRRPYSAPEQLGMLGLAAAALAAVWPAVSARTGLALHCPLRTLTGIPCPLCGMTTAAARLAAGDLHAALAANPFVLLLVGLTAGMAVLLALRALSLAGPPAPWTEARRRQAWWATGLLAAASWAFQLHRFGWV